MYFYCKLPVTTVASPVFTIENYYLRRNTIDVDHLCHSSSLSEETGQFLSLSSSFHSLQDL
ncbi:hypothetical protein HanPI659440_Chr07g0265901 [Helianthus annuus]|nr:hypothetical protein HanPI659440_Chr07g0265901 [Helianthus annuus]